MGVNPNEIPAISFRALQVRFTGWPLLAVMVKLPRSSMLALSVCTGLVIVSRGPFWIEGDSVPRDNAVSWFKVL
jgi:hypothetical protein